MRAVVYRGPRDYEIADVTLPSPAGSDMILAVVRAGLCGTDLHLHEGEFGPRFPLTPGHEVIGRVVEPGPEAEFERGELVAVDPGIHCGRCDACKGGEPLFCANVQVLGIQVAGGFAEKIMVSSTRCFPLGDLSVDDAALLEPMACAIHGIDQLDLNAGARVLVIGAGPTGQILALLAQRNGAANVTIAAPTPFKLEIARELGIDRTILIDRADPMGTEELLRAVEPDGFDAVVEASGSTAMLEIAIRVTARGGTVLVYGMAGESDTTQLSPYDIFQRQLTIRGSYAQALEFPRAIQYLRSATLPLGRLITHRFALDQYPEALSALSSSECLKAVLEFPESLTPGSAEN
jgi:D-arabinitol dehydrogenase (NADP+)